jgi:hypothetical protein
MVGTSCSTSQLCGLSRARKYRNPSARAPDAKIQTVGVAGFEPTASSSRTAGRAVDGGYFRTSPAIGGRSGTVLVSLVAVFRSCTAAVAAQDGTSRAQAARTRHGTWFCAG